MFVFSLEYVIFYDVFIVKKNQNVREILIINERTAKFLQKSTKYNKLSVGIIKSQFKNSER